MMNRDGMDLPKPSPLASLYIDVSEKMLFSLMEELSDEIRPEFFSDLTSVMFSHIEKMGKVFSLMLLYKKVEQGDIERLSEMVLSQCRGIVAKAARCQAEIKASRAAQS